MAAPVNYTTKISAAQTVAEMQALLAEHGARRIAVDYDDAGVPSALDFVLATPHGQRSFSLPPTSGACRRCCRTRTGRAG